MCTFHFKDMMQTTAIASTPLTLTAISVTPLPTQAIAHTAIGAGSRARSAGATN